MIRLKIQTPLSHKRKNFFFFKKSRSRPSSVEIAQDKMEHKYLSLPNKMEIRKKEGVKLKEHTNKQHIYQQGIIHILSQVF